MHKNRGLKPVANNNLEILLFSWLLPTSGFRTWEGNPVN